MSCSLDSYDFTGPWDLEAGSQTWLVRPPSRRSTRPIRLLVLLLGSVCAEALPLRLCEYTNIWCTQSIGCSSVKICSPRLRRNRCGGCGTYSGTYSGTPHPLACGCAASGPWRLCAGWRLGLGLGLRHWHCGSQLPVAKSQVPVRPPVLVFRAVLGVFTTVRLNRGAAASNAACASGQRQQH